ncbi:type III secretion system chaperone family protein [Robbsia andropogonis]|uniref:hypothetical protein n=1 Tax=Robbsia andropogonis TaxID=28092 RepID=UPI0004654939|nr:hypothetical protein [Robbsia andropogonis]MCP1117103.1 hypothetical protein [Robbsia andropogonis]MCP1128449.1 hypothetical protein [Robbsia andropogonis]
MKQDGEAAARRLIDAYLLRRGLPGEVRAAQGASKTRVVVFDQRYRVEMIPCREGSVLLRGRLTLLPSPGTQRDAVLLRLGRLALWSANRYRAYCVVDAAARAAWLQRVVDMAEQSGTSTGVHVDTSYGPSRREALRTPHVGQDDLDVFARTLGDFVNGFAAWRTLLARAERINAVQAPARMPVFFIPA